MFYIHVSEVRCIHSEILWKKIVLEILQNEKKNSNMESFPSKNWFLIQFNLFMKEIPVVRKPVHWFTE